MRRDLETAELPDEVCGIVSFVATQSNAPSRTRQLLYHALRRFTLASTGCLGYLCLDDQAATVLHKSMTLITELRFLVLSFTIKSGIGIGDGCMGVVLELLPLEVHSVVLATTCSWRAILGFETLYVGPCLNQGA